MKPKIRSDRRVAINSRDATSYISAAASFSSKYLHVMKSTTDCKNLKSYSSLTSLPDILDRLNSLEDEDKTIAESLHALVQNEGEVQKSLQQLKSLSPTVGNLRRNAESLSVRLGNTARTADSVAGHVRMLDEEIRRVKEASAYVAQVMELKVGT